MGFLFAGKGSNSSFLVSNRTDKGGFCCAGFFSGRMGKRSEGGRNGSGGRPPDEMLVKVLARLARPPDQHRADGEYNERPEDDVDVVGGCALHFHAPFDIGVLSKVPPGSTFLEASGVWR